MRVPGLVSFSAAGAIRVPSMAGGPRTAEMGRALGLTPVYVGVLVGEEVHPQLKLGWRGCINESEAGGASGLPGFEGGLWETRFHQKMELGFGLTKREQLG